METPESATSVSTEELDRFAAEPRSLGVVIDGARP